MTELGEQRRKKRLKHSVGVTREFQDERKEAPEEKLKLRSVGLHLCLSSRSTHHDDCQHMEQLCCRHTHSAVRRTLQE